MHVVIIVFISVLINSCIEETKEVDSWIIYRNGEEVKLITAIKMDTVRLSLDESFYSNHKEYMLWRIEEIINRNKDKISDNTILYVNIKNSLEPNSNNYRFQPTELYEIEKKWRNNEHYNIVSYYLLGALSTLEINSLIITHKNLQQELNDYKGKFIDLIYDLAYCPNYVAKPCFAYERLKLICQTIHKDGFEPMKIMGIEIAPKSVSDQKASLDDFLSKMNKVIRVLGLEEIQPLPKPYEIQKDYDIDPVYVKVKKKK